MSKRTKRVVIGAAILASLATSAGSCAPMPPEYEPAEPVGQGEQCFSIERSYPVEEELGIYCLPGVDPQDVPRGPVFSPGDGD